MYVGLVIYESLDTVSGGFLYDRRLVQHLRSTGARVDVIALPWRWYGSLLLQNLSRSLYVQLRDTPYDVLLQDELNHPSLYGINRRLRGQVPYPIVSIVHHLRISERHPFPLRWVYRIIERRYLRTVDGFIFNSRTTRSAVADAIGDVGPSVVAYPAGDRFATGLTPRQIASRTRQPRPLQIVFLGSIIPRKGLHTLLAAMANLPDDYARLTAIGRLDVNRHYVRSIRRQINRLALEPRVSLTGALPDDTAVEYLAHSDVMVVPSTYEGFGIVYVEGMAFGLPAIATTAGAAHEIIAESGAGYLVPPDAPGALAARLADLHENRERLVAMSLAARERFEAHPTWEDTTARIHRFLKQMAQ